jgi:hypothetical protein
MTRIKEALQIVIANAGARGNVNLEKVVVVTTRR